MPLAEYLRELDQLLSDAQRAFQSVRTPMDLDAARIEFLGARQGRLKAVQKGLAHVEPEQRKQAGLRFNDVKDKVQAAFEAAQQKLNQAAEEVPSEWFDLSLPGPRLHLGTLHPISQTIEELKQIMGRLGFTPADGPEIEDEWHNFEALNIAPEHPARDPLDNFFLAARARTSPIRETEDQNPAALMLRSQTSTVQIRVMESTPPPVRIISLGRVYRPDDVDATHFPMFHQMEGLYVDQGVTMAHLKSVLRMFASSYLGGEVHIRFRPSFFPFTEPSVEADFLWNDRWMEFGGAGMVDPHVLSAVGYDPTQVTGFAFGLGVERLCMRRHNITDIRDLFRNDLRFLRQFV